MRASIDLYYDITVQAEKVDNEIANDFLPVKIVAAKLPFVKPLPQENFAQIASPAQFLCAVPQQGIVWQFYVALVISHGITLSISLPPRPLRGHPSTEGNCLYTLAWRS